MNSRFSSSFSSNSLGDANSHVSLLSLCSLSQHKQSNQLISKNLLSSSKETSIMKPINSKYHHHEPDRRGKLSIQHLRFKYFLAFSIYTLCLVLLITSLATNKWLVSKPIRILRVTNGHNNLIGANATASLTSAITRNGRSHTSTQISQHNAQASMMTEQDVVTSWSLSNALSNSNASGNDKDTKFQGQIQFGLFGGTKVLNYGFGDRVSQLSVARTFFIPDDGKSQSSRPYEPVTFKCWMLTVTGVVLALLFALVGSIFAIINFVIVPQGTVTGSVGLISWNAAACACCLVAMFAWLFEYLTRLRWNVLTPEEVQTGWTSEDRSQIGQSYYFVATAFALHLVNIIIVSVVHSHTWWSSSLEKAKPQTSSSINEGVIMLY